MSLLLSVCRLSSAVLAQRGPACTDQPEYQTIKKAAEPGPRGEGGRALLEANELANALFSGRRQDVSAEALECIRAADEMRIEPGLLRRLFDQPWVDPGRRPILGEMAQGRWGVQAKATPPDLAPPPPPAFAVPEVLPPPRTTPPSEGVLTVPGLVVTDAFVALNADFKLRRPTDLSRESTIGGRSLRGTPGASLSLAEIGLEWRPGPKSRIHTEVIAGVDEAVMNAQGLGGSRAGVWEFFGEHTFDRGFTLVVGRFATLVGSEVPGPRNPNITNSFLFDSQPLSHIGGMVIVKAGSITAKAAISNGADIVFTPEFLPTGHLKIEGVPTDGMLLSVQAITGPQPVDDGTEYRHLYDLVFDYRPTDEDRVMVNVDYGANDYVVEPWVIGQAQWYGVAAYYQRELGPHRLAARLEGVHQNEAKNDAGTGPLWLAAGTATAGRRFGDHVWLRFEYRHDLATAPYYLRQGSGLTKSQDTGAVEVSVQF